MTRTCRGSSLVEFALLFPLVIFLVAGLFFTVLIGLRQIALAHEAQRIARRLALSALSTAPELEALASAETARRLARPTNVLVGLRPVPVADKRVARRLPRRLEIVSLELSQKMSFLNFSRVVRVSAAEVRVSAEAVR